MNVSDVLSREFFRPFATIVVPGAFAIAPYVLILNHYFPIIGETWREFLVSTSLVLFVVTIAMGLILEDIGARLELFWDYRLNKKQNPKDAPEDYHGGQSVTRKQSVTKYNQIKPNERNCSAKPKLSSNFIRSNTVLR